MFTKPKNIYWVVYLERKTDIFICELFKSKVTEISVNCLPDKKGSSSESHGISRNRNTEDWLLLHFIIF